MNAAGILRLIWLSKRHAPRVLAQGHAVRRRTPRLPAAEGLTGRVGPDGQTALRLVVIGDSVASAVGVDQHADALCGHLARRVAVRTGSPVEWTVLARSGATAGEVLTLADEHVLGTADIVVISVGVNDTKNLHTRHRWRAELGALLDHVIQAAPLASIAFIPIAPLEDFLALPAPLASVLGRRAADFNTIAADVISTRPQVIVPDIAFTPSAAMFAADGFHPSSHLHAVFADRIASAVDRGGFGALSPRRGRSDDT